MTILSILTSVYVMASVAGLAYQQIKPILDYVPSVVPVLVNIIEKAKERWEKFTLSEEQKHIERVKTFISEYQPLAVWVLRKLAVRLMVTWGILGLGLVLLVVGVVSFLKEASFLFLIIVVLVPVVGSLGNLWDARGNLFQKKDLGQILSNGEQTDQWMALWSTGKTTYEKLTNIYKSSTARPWISSARNEMVKDLTDIYQLGNSLSQISTEERVFIHHYIKAIEWLKMVEAMVANMAWLNLEIEKDDKKMLEKGEHFMSIGDYERSYYCYWRVCSILEQEKSSNPRDFKKTSEEVETRIRLGELLARQGDANRAVQQFEMAIELDRKNAFIKSIFSPNNSHIKPVQNDKAFIEFSNKYRRRSRRRIASQPETPQPEPSVTQKSTFWGKVFRKIRPTSKK